MTSLVPCFTGQSTSTLVYLGVIGFIAGLARGFSGFGSAMIFVPLASIAIGPVLASPLSVIIDTIGSMPLLPGALRGQWRRKMVAVLMFAGTLPAIPAGAWILRHADKDLLRWSISIAILLLVAWLAARRRFPGGMHPWVTIVVGVVSGTLTGAAQIGGPPAYAYWESRLPEPEVRTNMVLFLALSQVYAVCAYGIDGLLTSSVGYLALAAGPAFIVGVGIGMRMFDPAARTTYRRVCFIMIATAAILGLPPIGHSSCGAAL